MNKLTKDFVFRLGTFLARVNNIKFNIHLKLLNLRYGRGNIPADKLPAILPMSEEGKQDFYVTIKAAAIIVAICERFGVDYTETDFGRHFGRLINNQLLGHDDYNSIMTILHKPNLRRAIFEALIEYGDLEQRKLDFFLAGDKKDEFETWLDNKE